MANETKNEVYEEAKEAVEAEVKKAEKKVKKNRKPLSKKQKTVIIGGIVFTVLVGFGGVVYFVSRGKVKVPEQAIETATQAAVNVLV